MSRLPLAVIPVLGGRFFTQLAFGPIFTLVIVRLTDLGFDARVAALVQTSSMTGLIIGSFFAYRLINRLRHVRAYGLFAGAVGGCAILYSALPPPVPWFAIAFVMGASSFGITVVVESWLQHLAGNERRGQIMSFYMIIGQAAGAIGLLVVDWFDALTAAPFLFFAGLMIISPLPMLAARHHMPSVRRPRRLSLAALYRVSPLGIVATFVSGIVMGSQFGLSAVFALSRGDGFFGPGTYMAAVLVGGMVTMYPVGWLSDRIDRRRVMLGVFVALAVAAVGLTLAADQRWWLLVMAAVVGGLAAATYPLATSYVNDFLSDDQRVSANSGLMLAFSIGLLAGPLPAAQVMDMAGPTGLYHYISVISVLAALYTLWRMTRRPAPPRHEAEFMPAVVTPQARPSTYGLPDRPPAVATADEKPFVSEADKR
ncbi:MAG: MFS transporter [Alphaproteobacteria bacterium]